MEPAFPPDDQEARVVDLRPRAAARRLLDAESERDALRAHLDQVVAERDAARTAVRESQTDALAVREELAGRLAAETAAMSAVAVLRGQVEGRASAPMRATRATTRWPSSPGSWRSPRAPRARRSSVTPRPACRRRRRFRSSASA